MHPFSRRLDDNDLIEHFLVRVLEYRPENLDDVIQSIKEGEFQIHHIPDVDSTLGSTKHRRRKFAKEEDRWNLRIQIVTELFSQKRPETDEEISLGNGGAFPITDPQFEKKAIVIIGLPASGKSGIANELADTIGAIILDSDFAKRKLPEFQDGVGGASLVHNESDVLVFGSDSEKIPTGFKPLFQLAIESKMNLVIPKIGHKLNSVHQLGLSLKELGYETHLICVNLDRRKATIRAIGRFIESGRYVPIGLIFDGYANDPLNTYFLLKDGIDLDIQPFDSFGLISTDVAKGDRPRILQATSPSPIIEFQK
ncbi:zeta toxin family protein [Algoriphagus sp.]|uniref:zeta toxin family protein n=1 Tax=Algoriphagus sp. TaxID=1872435 RepID=UPI0027223BF6|nr:zeta toxin family protein [Algoriphagus sp.]MDO8969034.1 zeta toxin family protein [Algoriphagus sp.]MDP3198347.1 zeta toxin family protein [Algoriphagus sp.]